MKSACRLRTIPAVLSFFFFLLFLFLFPNLQIAIRIVQFTLFFFSLFLLVFLFLLVTVEWKGYNRTRKATVFFIKKFLLTFFFYSAVHIAECWAFFYLFRVVPPPLFPLFLNPFSLTCVCVCVCVHYASFFFFPFFFCGWHCCSGRVFNTLALFDTFPLFLSFFFFFFAASVLLCLYCCAFTSWDVGKTEQRRSSTRRSPDGVVCSPDSAFPARTMYSVTRPPPRPHDPPTVWKRRRPATR